MYIWKRFDFTSSSSKNFDEMHSENRSIDATPGNRSAGGGRNFFCEKRSFIFYIIFEYLALSLEWIANSYFRKRPPPAPPQAMKNFITLYFH